MQYLILIVLSYLIGSFPTAILAGKVLQKIDIRDFGSGNAGATNVFRVLGWRAGVVVLLVDMLKGFIPVFWLTPAIFSSSALVYYQMLAGIAAIFGHIWTVFAGFRGGKGVGTAAGVFLGLQPIPVLISLILFLIIVSTTRYVSLGSVCGALLLPITLVLKDMFTSYTVPNALLVLAILLALLIILTHRENIKRLINGTENKLNFSSTGEEQ
jgi:glycerol-3-phosphate acyltransferase PlsY